MNDLKLRRLRNKEEFRKSEEERRRKRLNETDAPSSEQPVSSSFLSSRPIFKQAETEGTSSAAEANGYPPAQQTSRPSSIGYHHTKSSPSSSVSMSQSPTKRPVVPPQSISRRLDSDNTDDSSDEDILEYAKRLERHKQAQSTTAKTADLSSSAIPVDTPVESTGAAAEEATLPCDVSELHQSKRRPLDDDDSDSDDLMAHAKAFQSAEAFTVQSSKVVQRLSPLVTETTRSVQVRDRTTQVRNPLVLLREQNDVVETRLPPQTLFASTAEKNLWSDSDDDVPLTTAKGRRKQGAEKPSTAANDPNSTNSTKNAKKRPASSSIEFQEGQKEPRLVLADETMDDTGTVNDDGVTTTLKPEFDAPKFGPFLDLPPFVLGVEENGEAYQVPASITRYLPQYQREGIQFMYRSAVQLGKGLILGDDMGLGKTVQTISFLAALFHKSGTGNDVAELKRRKKLATERYAKLQDEKDCALENGQVIWKSQNEGVEHHELPIWSPVLIFAPTSVVTNWVEDFKTWAHFSVAVYAGTSREAALKSVEDGVTEVLVCAQSMIQDKKSFHLLNTANVKWKLVIVDEFHILKNETASKAIHLRAMRNQHRCVIIGLTGTIMQNAHKELWNLVDIVAENHFGPYQQFDIEFARPIKLSRTTDAAPDVVDLGYRKAVELSRRLYEVYLRRSKEEVLSGILPQKDERIIFCEPSQLQKDLYRHIIEQPDYVLLKHMNAPCDCGVNQKFFLEYGHLRSQAEKAEYQRKHRNSLVKRGKCCFPVPKLHGKIDPGAVLWRQQHPGDVPCEKCPSCTLFTAISVLYKLCSHVALIQVKKSYERLNDVDKTSDQQIEAEKQLERAKQFIPSHLASKLPGGYFRECGMMSDHFNLSGKMVVLDKLLHAIQAQHGRVLVFSNSTQSLDLIENHITALGMSYSRMDGQTASKSRKAIADDFKSDPGVLIFLLSTKAMGVGLNLTQANFVIQFDVDWNPASDSQAQDRVYRIGQEKNVKVFRLVLRGTVEELKYLRQVYKTQLQKETIVPVDKVERQKASRLFRGVAGDVSRKGELFGLENILKFKDGTFMNYASQEHDSTKFGVGVHDTRSVLEIVKGMNEVELDSIGDDGDLFGSRGVCRNDAKRLDASPVPAPEEDDYDLGGMSQAVMHICEKAKVREKIADDGVTSSTSLLLEPTVDSGHASCDEVSRQLSEMIAPRPTETMVIESDDNDGTFESNASCETQSPKHVAIASTFEETARNAISYNSPNEPPNKSQSVANAYFSPDETNKPRNTRIAGISILGIRRGDAKKTTFSALDLYRPTGVAKGCKKST